MKINRKSFIFAIIFQFTTLTYLILGCAGTCLASTEQNFSRKEVNIIVTNIRSLILNNRRVKRVEAVIDKYFDYVYFAKYALWSHRETLSSKDYEKFAEEFRKVFIQKINREIPKYRKFALRPWKFNIVNQKSESAAVVAETTQEGAHIKFEFFMHKSESGKWKFYDVNINGVNMIRNYRSQFDYIIRRDGFVSFLTRISKFS